MRISGNSANTIIRLVMDTRTISCNFYVRPLAEIGLSSGVRYTPFGGTLKLYGQRLVRLPVTASLGYQTNFGSNYALRPSLICRQSGRRTYSALPSN